MFSKFFTGNNFILINISFVRDSFTDNTIKISNYKICLKIFRRTYKKFGGIRGDPVVAVQKLEIRSPSPADGQIAGIGDAGVGLVDGDDPGILGGVSIADGSGAVLAAVVDQDQFKVALVLI